MRSARRRGPTIARQLTLVVVAVAGAILGACATGAPDTYGPTDAAVQGEGGHDAAQGNESSVGESGGNDSATPVEGGAAQDGTSPGQDAGGTGSEGGNESGAGGDAGEGGTGGEAGTDATSPDASDSSATDGSVTDGSVTDGSVTESGPADTGVVDATGDGSNCSVGPGADYQATCTSCTISATCLLKCASCTTKAQGQNPNPSLQLPCPGTMAVQNIDGVLTCQ